MAKELLEKLATAYRAEIERLFTEAEARGLVDPMFTQEKRAAFYEFEEAAGPEILAQLDDLAFNSMTPLERITLAGGLGKLAAPGGLGEWSSMAMGKVKDLIGKIPFKKTPTAPASTGLQGAAHWARQRKVMSPMSKLHSFKGELMGGAAFGAGFGALQRAVAPKEEPTVQIGERPES